MLEENKKEMHSNCPTTIIGGFKINMLMKTSQLNCRVDGSLV
jgi:hypothetical protein